MEGEQVLGQRLDLMQRHRDHAGVAVAGGHTVDHAFLVQQGVEEARALGDLFPVGGIILQLGAGLALRQGYDVLDGQGALAEDHRLRLVCRHLASRKGRS